MSSDPAHGVDAGSQSSEKAELSYKEYSVSSDHFQLGACIYSIFLSVSKKTKRKDIWPANSPCASYCISLPITDTLIVYNQIVCIIKPQDVCPKKENYTKFQTKQVA